jgi:hypothetical protein
MNPLRAATIYWHLPFLIIVISLVYSATRFDRWDLILWEALRWGKNMALFLLGAAAVIYLVSTFI